MAILKMNIHDSCYIVLITLHVYNIQLSSSWSDFNLCIHKRRDQRNDAVN